MRTRSTYIRRLLLAAGILSTSVVGQAQTFNDIILQSQQQVTGTARNTAVGGSMTAVGGDYSSMATNPAGIGMYHSTNFSISGGFGIFHGKEEYHEMNTTQLKPFGSFDGLNLVLHIPMNSERTSGFLGCNIGFGYNKSADYSHSYTAEGHPGEVGFLDAIAQMAMDNSYPLDAFKSDAKIRNAFANYDWYLVLSDLTGAVAPFKSNGEMAESDTPYDQVERWAARWPYDASLYQRNELSTTGHSSEIDFALAFNYSNRLFFGATLAVPLYYRSWTRTFSESSTGEDIDDNANLASVEYVERGQDDAAGVNLKLGVMGKITEGLRVGLAFHTPTYLRTASQSSVDMTANYYTGKEPSITEKSPESEYNYSTFGPMRGIGSISYVFGRYGFIAASYQLTALPLSQFSDNSDFREDNRILQDEIRSMHQINLGGELLFGAFALRLGGGYQTSPYSKEMWNPHGERYWFSGGLGYAGSVFSVDVAYRHMILQGEGPIYSYDSPVTGAMFASSKRKGQQGLLTATLGIRL